MDSYVTGTAIRQLREAKHMTQAELAEKLAVSAKAISKWETARGLPDISLLEPLAAALGVSVLELMQGEPVVNRNRSANLLRSKLYICPVCGKYTFEYAGDFDICPVCNWEDDLCQLENPDEEDCANHMSLNQAREAWAHGRRVDEWEDE